MKRLLTLKGVLLVAIVVIIAAGGAAYAVNFVFDRAVTAKLNVVVISEQPIEVYEDDSVTVVNEIDFGTIHIPAFGYFQPPAPPVHQVVVKNLSPVAVEVVIMGDGRDDILPVFGATEADLKPAALNAFTLQPESQPGDTMEGWVGIVFQVPVPSSGAKETTIMFRATEVEGGTQPAILSSGETILPGTWRFDFDLGRVESRGETGIADVLWDQINSTERYLVPQNGASLHLFSSTDFEPLTLTDLQAVEYSDDRLNGRDNESTQITEGTVLGVHTNEGRYSKVLIVSYGYDLIIRWVTYEDGGDEQPSPARIAFASERDGNWEIYVMNADGSNQTNLTNHGGYDHQPAWSPNGRKIAFNSARSGKGGDIYLMDSDGSNLTPITNNDFSDGDPSSQSNWF